jgi:coenzyme F420-reducing hydrogenase alpha subunit
MSAARAVERAWGITVDPAAQALRRLLYCGEWIESHALHIYFLQAPDLLGFDDAIALAAVHPEPVKLALRLKRIGNELMSVLGGREIHPVSVAVGGVHRAPAPDELARLVPELEWALEASVETVRWAASLPVPEFQQDYEFVALRPDSGYPIEQGRVVSSRGLDVEAEAWEEHFAEQQVRHSNALHSVVRERGSFLTGPLARYALNYDRLTPRALAAARSVDLAPPVRNPFQGVVVRAVETVVACEEALALIGSYRPPEVARAAYQRRAGSGAAATEAPRGLLYHRYAIDADGLITRARIVPPTAQNLKRMEDDLWGYLPQLLGQTHEAITLGAEAAVRNYDPCISCATHFLRLYMAEE